ncbi:hypothetical protein Tco_1439984 [Tanacetum coccineum]
MFKLDLEPLAPRLLQNREAHIDYLKYTQEQADILRGIVKQAKAKQPLDKELDFACKHAQRIQELLVYVRDTCPNAINLSIVICFRIIDSVKSMFSLLLLWMYLRVATLCKLKVQESIQSTTQTNHNLWDIIVNGDLQEEPAPTGDQFGPSVPKLQNKGMPKESGKELWSILLLAIPDEYLLKFHNVPDAKSL